MVKPLLVSLTIGSYLGFIIGKTGKAIIKNFKVFAEKACKNSRKLASNNTKASCYTNGMISKVSQSLVLNKKHVTLS